MDINEFENEMTREWGFHKADHDRLIEGTAEVHTLIKDRLRSIAEIANRSGDLGVEVHSDERVDVPNMIRSVRYMLRGNNTAHQRIFSVDLKTGEARYAQALYGPERIGALLDVLTTEAFAVLKPPERPNT